MKIEQLDANNFVYADKDKRVLQSYGKIIAIEHQDGTVLLDETYYNYSKTTTKYRNKFLDLSTKEIDAKIKSGEFIIGSLQEK